MKKQKVLILFLVLNTFQTITGSTIFGQNRWSTVDSIPTDPNLRVGRLSNGFTYYIRKNGFPEKKVMMCQVTSAGLNQEARDQMGLAHLLEHTPFHGTNHFPNPWFFFESNGLNKGDDVNANTSDNRTLYFVQNIPSENSELVQKALLFLRELSQGNELDSATIERCRGEVLAESRGSQTRFYINEIIGNPGYIYPDQQKLTQNIKSFKPESLLSFYHDWYCPDLQAVIVVGDIELDKIEEQIRNLFADLRPIPNSQKTNENYPSFNWKNNFIVDTTDEKSFIDMLIYMKHPKFSLKSIGDFRNHLIVLLYNEMIASRLSVLNEISNKSCRSIHNSYQEKFDALGPDFGALITSISMIDKGHFKDAFQITISELERLRRYGFLETELATAKSKIQSDQVKETADSKTIMSDLVRHFTDQTAYPSLEFKNMMINGLIEEITIEEVNEKVKSWISDFNRDIIILAPKIYKSFLPDEPAVLDWINEIKATRLEEYKKDELNSAPLMTEKEIKQLSFRGFEQIELDKIGVTKLILANGIKVYLKSLDVPHLSGEDILLHGFSPSGACNKPDNGYFSTLFASGIVAQSGLGPFNSVELKSFMKGHEISYITPYILHTSKGIMASCSVDGIEPLLQMVHEYFVNPNVDQDALRAQMKNIKDQIEGPRTSSKIFRDTILTTMNNRLFREPTSVGQISSITLNDVYNAFKKQFSNARDFTFIISGHFNINTIKPLIIKYLGALPSFKQNQADCENNHTTYPSGVIQKTVFAGEDNEQAEVTLYFSGRYVFNSRNNLQMEILNYLLRDELMNRLRVREAATYGVGTSVSYSKDQKRGKYYFNVNFLCHVDKVAHMIKCTMEELNLIKTELDSIAFGKAIASERRKLREGHSSPEFWLNYLKDQAKNDESVTQIVKRERELSELTVKKLKKSAKRYLHNDHFCQFVLMPENLKYAIRDK